VHVSPLKSNRLFTLLLPLFVGSGAAALIYEIVWFQMLQLITGSSATAMAILLGTFMGGMCAGSLALPTVFMGATLPALALGGIDAIRKGGRFTGFLVLLHRRAPQIAFVHQGA
jgi:hypothetical protein